MIGSNEARDSSRTVEAEGHFPRPWNRHGTIRSIGTPPPRPRLTGGPGGTQLPHLGGHCLPRPPVVEPFRGNCHDRRGPTPKGLRARVRLDTDTVAITMPRCLLLIALTMDTRHFSPLAASPQQPQHAASTLSIHSHRY